MKMLKNNWYNKIKEEPWFQRIDDTFEEDLQGDCVAFIEGLLEKQKTKKPFPRLTIERYLMDDEEHITGIDMHDEKFGEAIFFNGNGSRHRHGFMNNGEYEGKE